LYVFDFDFCDAAAAAFPSGFPLPPRSPGLAFFGIKILAKFDPTVEKLIKFTLEKPRKNSKFSQCICQKMETFNKKLYNRP
jgi:hypothetical protein